MPHQSHQDISAIGRRDLLAAGMGAASIAGFPLAATAQQAMTSHPATPSRADSMSYVTTKDGVQIFYKDWGPRNGQPIVFHHGWPLSSDDWDAQLLFFVSHGYRVVAHDRRGHGRSSQLSDGHDMDHYAAYAAAVVEHLDLRNEIGRAHV